MEVLLIILCSGLFILLVLSIVIIVSQRSQVSQLSEMVLETENNTLNVYTFILETLTKTYIDLQRVDKRGAFSSDDEVGIAFKIILESIEQVKFQIEKMDIVEKIE